MNAPVWLAECDTEHYAWRAVGRSEAEARALLAAGMIRGGVDVDWVRAMLAEENTDWDDAQVLDTYYAIAAYSLTVGQTVLRDDYDVASAPPVERGFGEGY